MRELSRETAERPDEGLDRGSTDVPDRPADVESPSALRDRINRESEDASPSPSAQYEDANDWPDAQGPADRIRPLTDVEWAEHVTEVRDELGKAASADLATDRQYTTPPDHTEWTPERNRIQGSLVADLYEQARDVPCDARAIIAGGLGGAGKTAVLETHAGIDRSKYLTINPDNIKEEMASRGLVPNVAGLSPMEASELVHEESSYIAKRLAQRAVADGKNLIWDITMSTLKTTQTRINDLRSTGYSVDGIFVDIPLGTSIQRTEARHREGHEEYRTGKGLGGRYLAPEIIKAQADSEWGSKNRRTFEVVRHDFGRWSRFDNSVDDRAPILVETNTTTPEDSEKRADEQRNN